MKNKIKSAFMVALMGTGLLFTSCSDTENITPDETTTYDGTLEMVEDQTPSPVVIFASDVQGDAIKVLVKMTSETDNMRRVYITRNADGAGEEPFKWEGTGITNNGDDSVNLDAGKVFTQEFVIPKSSTVTGTEVYRIWATKSKGDFRNSENSFIVGVGTITINYGGANGDSPVKAFSAKILAAPLADGTSQSFISTVNGQLYAINGAAETSAYWDLGYYYGATDNASLVSPATYPAIFTVDGTPKQSLRAMAGLDASASLNHFYITKSNKTSGDFDNIEIKDDLDFITKPTSETVTKIVDGDMLEFVDNYGKKGLIRVVDVKGTYNSGDYIQIDVKVQR